MRFLAKGGLVRGQYRDSEAWKELVDWCRRDRDALIEKMVRVYPEFRGRPPSAWVEDLIASLCGYRVHDMPLPVGQLGLCDAANRLVLINSEMWRFVGEDADLRAVRAKTLGHELGHIRLHGDELEERYISLHGRWDNNNLDSRHLPRETEADLYAAIFLVPDDMLLRHARGREIYRAWHEGREIPPGRLSFLVQKLAVDFGIGASVMRRSLEERGWLQRVAKGYRIRSSG